MAIHILIISDDKPGHVNQSFGLVESLRKKREVEIGVVKLSYRLKFLRPLLNSLVRRSEVLASFFESRLVEYSGDINFVPNLVISSGGYTCASNVLLTRKFGAKNIFLGTPKGFDLTFFSLVISTSSLDQAENNLVVDVMPQRFDERLFKQAATEFVVEKSLNAKTVYWTLLIGGPTHYYKYSQSDWEVLIAALNALAEKHHIKWLVSTSRRTPKDIEEYLESALCANPNIAYLVIYNRKPEKCLSAFFGLSSFVFCTEDSTSMLSEAIVTGLPVVSLSANTVGKPDQGHYELVQNLSSKGSIQRLKFEAVLEEVGLVFSMSNIERLSISEEVLKKLEV